eukprot:tig00021339_g20445.t1
MSDDKRAAFEERLAAAEASRAVQRELKQAQREEHQDPGESAAAFHQTFTKEKNAIAEALGAAKALQGEEASARLDELAARVAELQASVTRAARFLPPYDLRQSQDVLARLEKEHATLKAAVAPKKKFAFSSRRTPSPGTSASAAAPAPTQPPEASREEPPAPAASQPAGGPLDERTVCIAGLAGQVLVRGAGELEPGRDVILRDLKDCDVFLLQRTSALHIHRVENCRVHAGPVDGSVRIEGAERCSFSLMSRQIRIHDAKGCDFYVHVRSGPIIEHCSGLRFAPYNLSYPELPSQSREAGFEGVENRWAAVEDFRWLRTQQSPNWSVLPEGERVAVRR